MCWYGGFSLFFIDSYSGSILFSSARPFVCIRIYVGLTAIRLNRESKRLATTSLFGPAIACRTRSLLILPACIVCSALRRSQQVRVHERICDAITRQLLAQLITSPAPASARFKRSSTLESCSVWFGVSRRSPR